MNVEKFIEIRSLTSSLVSDPQMVDSFFMENVWDRKDIEKLQVLTMDLLDGYVQVLANHSDLSFQDTYHLASEKGYLTICAFIDTAYRLKHNQFFSESTQVSVPDFRDLLAGFFSEETVRAHLGFSRILRCDLANIMLHTLGSPPKFGKIQQEPDLIRLEDLDLPLAKQEKYWQMHYKLTDRIPNGVVQYSRANWNRLRQHFRNNLVRIGYLHLNRKYMWQLPDIQWVRMDMDLENYFVPVHLENRQELYQALREKFLEKVSHISGWDRASGRSIVSNELLELLLAFILLKAEPLLFQTKRLHQAIGFYEQSLQTMRVRALYSQGQWFRFQYAVIAVAARRIGLPIIEFQHGGAIMYRAEKVQRTQADFYLAWGGIAELSQYKKVNGIPVPNPEFKSSHAYVKRKSSRPLRIMYTPISLSTILPMEITLSASENDIENHRQWVSDLFLQCEDVLEKTGSSLYIKLKGFGYTLFSNHENMIIPRIKLETVPVRYLKNGSAGQYMDHMDLHIFCGPSTTFAESLARDIPSICLWDPACYEPKSVYKNLFTELDQAGIIVTNAHSFSSVLNKRLGSDEWWSKETQLVRRKFCENMAYSSDEWVSINNAALLEVIS